MIFINEGDTPLSLLEATKRGINHVNRELGAAGARKGDETIFVATAHADLPDRLIDVLSKLPNAPATYSDYTVAWDNDNVQNGLNNLFNHQLFAYRVAVQRLSQYRLAEGRKESTFVNEFGEKQTISAIEPLSLTIKQTVYDEDSGQQIGTKEIPNPEVITDDEERAQAQEIIDNTPASVIGFS